MTDTGEPNDQVIKSNIRQYERLKSALAAQDFIGIYGPSSSGKTYLVQRALRDSPSILHVMVDCNQITTSSKLYLTIVALLREKLELRNLRARTQELPKIMSVLDFMSSYRDITEVGLRKGFKTFYIVLDRLEKLTKTIMIDCLVVLAGLDRLNLILISIESTIRTLSGIKSAVGKESFYNRICMIQLSPWTSMETVDIICLQKPIIEPEMYRTFVTNATLMMYKDTTRDYSVIKSFCLENYPTYHQFYMERLNQSTKEESKEIVSILNSFLGTVSTRLKKRNLKNWNHEEIDRKTSLEMSILITAAYVGSYTKVSDDKRNFVQFQKRKVSGEKVNGTESEGKAAPFTLERLLHIYQALALSVRGELNKMGLAKSYMFDSVLSDIQLLEDLNLIKVVSGDGLNPQTRYKLSSNVSKSYVRRLAAQINLPFEHIHGVD